MGIREVRMKRNMRAERVRNCYTIQDVAKIIGVHPNAVNRWELGKTKPSAENLISLCELYGCSPEYLLGLTDERNGTAAVRGTD